MIIWLIGMSGSGKTVIGRKVYEELKKEYRNTIFLDGDMLREIMGNDLGHSLEDRKKNADRFCRMCKYFDDHDINAVCGILSLFHESQEWNRNNLKSYFEIYLDVSLKELMRRDSKGLYKKALNGEITNVVGVDIEFKMPVNPDLIIKNEGDLSIQNAARTILEKIPRESM